MKMDELDSFNSMHHYVKIVDGSTLLALLVTMGHGTLTGWFACDTVMADAHAHAFLLNVASDL